jgi:NAD(P)-dependent dehydrogenase (short-subunit alcohol dehydrogenase family)
VNDNHQWKKIMAKLTGKIGVVTGGGTGIGRATALAMAKAGAVVVIGNREAGKGEEVVGLIRQAGGKAVFQKTDVSKPADVQALGSMALSADTARPLLIPSISMSVSRKHWRTLVMTMNARRIRP